jgi:hypothetical protein
MAFFWRAYYEDGSELWQTKGDKGEHKVTYADIDRDRLIAFGLFQGDLPVVLVDFRDDTNGSTTSDIGPKRLIWRVRHQQSSNGLKNKIHLVGWQRKVKGRNIQSICFVAENGTVILGGQWQDDVPLRGGITHLPFEKDLD